MTTKHRVSTKSVRGAGRAPTISSIASRADVEKVRELIDQHQGVASRMAKDRKGLRAAGLLDKGADGLSHMTLRPRLMAITLVIEGVKMTALDYATSVRVKFGKSGPRESPVAQQTVEAVRKAAAANAEERARVLDAMARTRSVSAAARALGMPRPKLVRHVVVLGIKDEHVEARRAEIATCPACAAKALGIADEPKQHTCK